MYKLSVDITISGAHRLNNYVGDCTRLHGHNWKIRVTVISDRLNEAGMVIDFKDLQDLSWQVVGRFDHQFFNEIGPFTEMNPTAENLARHFYNEIDRRLPKHVRMDKISIWETEKYLVEYVGNNGQK